MSEILCATAAPEPNEEPSATDPKEAAFMARLNAAREIANKHGYYFSVLSEEEKVEYALALEREGFEHEIAFIKTKVKCMQILQPFNLSIVARLLMIADRLAKTQRALFTKDKDEVPALEKAVENVFAKHNLPRWLLEDGLKESPGPA